MSLIDTYIQKALDIINDHRYYYDMNRTTEWSMDCSLLVIESLRRTGIISKATWTGNLESALVQTGLFVSMPFKSTSLKRGDILLRHISADNAHTVIYIGDGKIAEACNKKYGLRVIGYYANNYQTILRYKGKQSIDLPLLKVGSEGILVGLLQVFLNKYDQNRLKPDMEFGPKTKEAVKNFQAHYNDLAKDRLGHPIEIDGEVGPETWLTISIIMERS